MEKYIHSAYQGEIYGISFFTYFNENYGDESLIPLWRSLIKIETLTANLLELYLLQNDIEYVRNDSSMIAKGIQDASTWINLPWPELVETLINWIEPYENKYRTWINNVSHDVEIFNLIAEHETAIFQCWKSEQNGISGIPFITEFISKHIK